MDLLGFNELGNPLPTDELWARFDTATPNYQYPQDQYTFLVMAQSGTDIGKKPHSDRPLQHRSELDARSS